MSLSNHKESQQASDKRPHRRSAIQRNSRILQPSSRRHRARLRRRRPHVDKRRRRNDDNVPVRIRRRDSRRRRAQRRRDRRRCRRWVCRSPLACSNKVSNCPETGGKSRHASRIISGDKEHDRALSKPWPRCHGRSESRVGGYVDNTLIPLLVYRRFAKVSTRLLGKWQDSC